MNKWIILSLSAIVFLLFGCKEQVQENRRFYIADLNIFLDLDFNERKLSFFHDESESPSIIEFKDNSNWRIEMYCLPPDTILVVPCDMILKIQQNNFDMLFCESDSTGEFHSEIGLFYKYPKEIIQPHPTGRGFKINTNTDLNYLMISDSEDKSVFNFSIRD